MNTETEPVLYRETIVGGGMWSKVVSRGKVLRLTDLEGGEAWYESGNIVCGNSKIMRQLLPLVKWSGHSA